MSTTITPPTSLDRLRTKQQQAWSSGDYNRIAAITVPVSESLVRRADPRPGERVLDVATGTGHAALAAARRGARVTGIDYVPALVFIARRRAAAELFRRLRRGHRGGPPLRRRFLRPRPVGDRRHVRRRPGPEPPPSWSASPAPADASRSRAGHPRVSSAACSRRSGRHVPPPPAAQSPTRGGDPQTVRGLLGDDVIALTASRATVPQRFASAQAFADFFLTWGRPTRPAAAQLDEVGRQALRDEMVELAADSDRGTDGTFVSDWEYLLVTTSPSHHLDTHQHHHHHHHHHHARRENDVPARPSGSSHPDQPGAQPEGRRAPCPPRGVRLARGR